MIILRCLWIRLVYSFKCSCPSPLIILTACTITGARTLVHKLTASTDPGEFTIIVLSFILENPLESIAEFVSLRDSARSVSDIPGSSLSQYCSVIFGRLILNYFSYFQSLVKLHLLLGYKYHFEVLKLLFFQNHLNPVKQ